MKAFIDQAIGSLSSRDQATAKSALADLMRDNDAGHARLQGKLRG